MLSYGAFSGLLRSHQTSLGETYRKESPEVMKTDKQKQLLLEQLRKTPIVEIACEKAGISRATYYRWRKENSDFTKTADEAIIDGESFINDMSESQVISLIKEKNWPAISFWLKHHHPKYANKIEVEANIKQLDEKLTPEQEAIVRKALEFISGSEQESSEKNNDQTTKESD